MATGLCVRGEAGASNPHAIAACLQTAVGKVAANATAFPWRKALFCSQLRSSNFTSAAGAAKARMVLRPVRDALQLALNSTASYLNYIDVDVSTNPMESYYGGNLKWLRSVKQRYDPNNFFGITSLSIPPASGPTKVVG